MSLVKGLHHMTVCVGGAQEDIDFQTQVFGQRMIKQTVLFDGRYAHYHLYYANANAEPGSVYTTFPYGRVRGRQGSGQIQATAYTVPKGSLKFWLDHLKRHKITNGGIQERFGQKFIRFDHPSGIQLEVLEDTADKRKAWTVGEVTGDVATRGFHGPVLSVREIAETERFFVDALGFKKTGQEGPYHRFEIGDGGAAKTVTLLHEPERPSGSWIFGAGTAHHMALEVESDEKLTEQKGIYEELGYTDASEIKDRMYFHSVYCRCPGGILVECAATVPAGFAVDEPADQLGQSLLLPPWFEARRTEIEGMLEPIKVPESNFPGGMKKAPVKVPATAAAAPASGASRRTSAVFIGGDKPQKKN
ncbi:MAG TPA: ring-cleaving dioxygenase [Candidatus Acidoferrales bacterium]|nr:ring-cleaving dioxygenase [Candidatus Acidoferrales bacterium]